MENKNNITENKNFDDWMRYYYQKHFDWLEEQKNKEKEKQEKEKK